MARPRPRRVDRCGASRVIYIISEFCQKRASREGIKGQSSRITRATRGRIILLALPARGRVCTVSRDEICLAWSLVTHTLQSTQHRTPRSQMQRGMSGAARQGKPDRGSRPRSRTRRYCAELTLKSELRKRLKRVQHTAGSGGREATPSRTARACGCAHRGAHASHGRLRLRCNLHQ